MARLQRRGQLGLAAGVEQVAYGFNRAQAHTRRSPGGKDTEDQFFPEARVRALRPDTTKLRQPRLNLRASRPVRPNYIFNGDGLA